MKLVLLTLIKLYWMLVPEKRRRKCIFKVSCSNYVYQTTKKDGLIKGLAALKYRFLNCRSGFHTFEHPINGSKMMILPNKQMIPEHEISEKFLK